MSLRTGGDVPLEDDDRSTRGVHESAEERERLAAVLGDLATLSERGALVMHELGGFHYRQIAGRHHGVDGRIASLVNTN